MKIPTMDISDESPTTQWNSIRLQVRLDLGEHGGWSFWLWPLRRRRPRS